VQARRVEQDKIEAEIAEQKRREVMDRAQRLLYEQNERVKVLRSAMLESEVIKARRVLPDLMVLFANPFVLSRILFVSHFGFVFCSL
jgi:hypothetical protein